MLWGILLLILAGALLLPLTIQADVHRFGTTNLHVRVQFAGLHKTWTRTGLPGSGMLQDGRAGRLAALLRQADKSRHFLLHHLRLEYLASLILIRTEDAARSALLSGALQGVLACIPMARRRHMRIRILPEFFRAHSTVDVRCIIRPRLGTLLLTAGLLCLDILLAQRLTESEAT